MVVRRGSALRFGNIAGQSIRFEGLDQVLDNLNKEIEKIKKVSVKNLLQVGLLIKGKANRKVPVDTSNLKGSAYVIAGGGKAKLTVDTQPNFQPPKSKSGGAVRFKQIQKLISQHSIIISSKKIPQAEPFVIIGYTAFYALFVHEDLGVQHKGDKQAKFLEQALTENRSEILRTLKGEIE